MQYRTAQSIAEGIDQSGSHLKTNHREPLPPVAGSSVAVCLIVVAQGDTTLILARADETAGEVIEVSRAAVDYCATNTVAGWVPRGRRFFQQEIWRMPSAVYAQVRAAFNRGI